MRTDLGPRGDLARFARAFDTGLAAREIHAGRLSLAGVSAGGVCRGKPTDR